ncbi:hypothetical protein TcWFU_004362 [Taenia crassiceps]|uniref:Uncharacterized protein n=1 Tax=Taenia crassiceps TaxID=6207 RepID=A0ABR4QQV6_9CEST
MVFRIDESIRVINSVFYGRILKALKVLGKPRGTTRNASTTLKSTGLVWLRKCKWCEGAFSLPQLRLVQGISPVRSDLLLTKHAIHRLSPLTCVIRQISLEKSRLTTSSTYETCVRTRCDGVYIPLKNT